MNFSVFKKRVYIAGLLIVIISVVFIIRLFTLHFSPKILINDSKKTPVKRGLIVDRNGYILAMTIEMNSLFANPEEIRDPDETARVISPLLQMPVQSVMTKLKARKKFIWIKRKLDKGPMAEIKKLAIRGLYFKKEYKRVYPHNRLASNIIGFVGIDNKGLEGIEYHFEKMLTFGNSGILSSKNESILKGRNVILTIDRYIQHVSEREIERTVRDHNARQGIVLVMEVKTGKIIALAKYPDFNPNRYYSFSVVERRNFSVIDSFEPGSTLKIMALASMLEYNPGIMKSSFECAGKIDIADATINCTGVHGNIGISDIIRHSCNVGIIKAARKLKKQQLYSTLIKFGFGNKTAVELPGESEGLLRPVKQWSGLSKYSISIGHEISVTSIQLAAAFCAVANRGIYTRPSVVKAIENSDGSFYHIPKPESRGRIISSANARKIMKMMRGVVENGTGRNAASQYFMVSGKTGTSKKYVRGKGYSERVLSSFIGIAPTGNPELCILVIVDDPADRLSGGKIATPVFAKIIDRSLLHLGVKRKGYRALPPLKRKNRDISFNGKEMPDFRGSRLSESLEALSDIRRRYGIPFYFSGSGEIVGQVPVPGVSLKGKKKILLKLAE